MYLVSITNNGVKTWIHNHVNKLSSGKVVKGINAIDSFTFTINPLNVGYNQLYEYKTLVEVYNTSKNRYEFQGRVLIAPDTMDDSGLITKEATCESLFGYLCDSQQEYVEEQNWTVEGLLSHIINTHNGQVEAEKHFTIRTINVEDPNDNLYVGIQRENTWETIKKKLIDTLGGEIRFEVDGETIYLDYLKKIGTTKTTEIALSKNMKSITREKDPTEFITRVIPLGAKIADDSEERLDISSVNNGKKYIDDTEAIEKYGIHVGYIEFDDVTDEGNLRSKGISWLTENNKVLVRYSVTALDLSLLGLDIDDFDVFNYYPIRNSLLGVDDTARIIKKTIDICEEVKSTIEIGDNFKTLSELQKEQAGKMELAANIIGTIYANYLTNAKLTQELEAERLYTTSLIEQSSTNITASVSANYLTKTSASSTYLSKTSASSTYATKNSLNTYKTEVTAELELKIDKDDDGTIISLINQSADVINLTADRLNLTGDKVKISADETIIGGFTITDKYLYFGEKMGDTICYSGLHSNIGESYNGETNYDDTMLSLVGRTSRSHIRFFAGVTNWNDKNGTAKFAVLDDGSLYASAAKIEGNITSTSGTIGGFTIGTNSLTAQGMGISTGAYSFWTGGNTPESAAFRVSGSSFYGFVEIDDGALTLGSLEDGYSGWFFDKEQLLARTMHSSRTIIKMTDNGSSAMAAVNMWADSFTKSSDADKKNSITYIANDITHDVIFDNLKPLTFKYNDDAQGKLHYGFTTQNLKETLNNVGIDETEFAAYCQSESHNRSGKTEIFLGIDYTEFIALCVDQIQKLKKRVIALENK